MLHLPLLLLSLAWAQDDGTSSTESAPPSETPAPPVDPQPPEGAPAPAEAAASSDAAPAEQPAPVEEAKAPKQWRWAALPIVNYSSTYGLGYGAYGNIVNNGKGDIGNDPYRAKIALQIYFTTGSYYDNFLKLDFPSILGSRFRWDFQAGITGWPTASWYGWGNDQLRIELPSDQAGTVDWNGDGRVTEQDLDAEPEHLGCYPKTADGDVATFTDAYGLPVPCYYNYGQQASVKVITNLRRELTGPWSIFVNYYLRSYTLHLYPGSLVDTAQPVGSEGGLYMRLGLGGMFDTRNQEPSPTKGMFAEASVRGGMNVTSPDERVVGINLTDRRWYGFGKKKRLVLASREIVDMKWGNEPFFMSQTIGGSEDLSVGTSVLMRGLPYGRLAGDGAVFWTPELRWQYAAIPIGRSELDLVTGPYFDVGRVWLWDPESLGLTPDDPLHLHYTYGLGNRIIFNEDLVIRLDFGFGKEEYVDQQGATYTANNFGLFLVFDHPY